VGNYASFAGNISIWKLALPTYPIQKNAVDNASLKEGLLGFVKQVSGKNVSGYE